jgi:transcriptional regulator with XRE-family HTH domain
MDGPPFGVELRRRRMQAGLSLADLAAKVHYDKGHLSKVENGRKLPSKELARYCDTALGCAGDLARLVPGGTAPASLAQPSAGLWMLSLGVDGTGVFRSVPPPRGPAEPVPALDADAIETFQAMYALLRNLGQRTAPQLLLGTLLTQTQALSAAARQSLPPDRDRALTLAACFAEYAGWIAQEAGDDTLALRLTELAVRHAVAAGDQEMAAYGLVRRGLLAMYQGDAEVTIRLARQARSATRSPRVAGLAAQREAQGHALAGDYDRCLRDLDGAAELLAVPHPPRAGPVIGSGNVADPAAMARGWCLVDLGRSAAAVPVLSHELGRIPAPAHRSRARYGIRLAIALADIGELEEACAVAGPAMDAFDLVQSATVRRDVRRLARILDRKHARREVTDTRLRLTRALHGHP